MIHSNFTAELHSQHGQVCTTTKNFLGTKGELLFPISGLFCGWMCHSHGSSSSEFVPLRLHFDFIREEKNRILYAISADETFEFYGARLHKNDNDWLGLYGTGVLGRLVEHANPVNIVESLLDVNYWKFEPLQAWDGDNATVENIEFYLRDKEGHRVSEVIFHDAYAHPGYRFLNAGKTEGEVLKFKLRNVQVE